MADAGAGGRGSFLNHSDTNGVLSTKRCPDYQNNQQIVVQALVSRSWE
jgi:hypothetical protein